MTSGGMSCERSGAIARGTSRVSAAPPGTNTLAVTPLPSSSCASVRGFGAAIGLHKGSPHRVETGRDIDDATPPLRQKCRQHGPRHQESGNDVDINDPAKLFRRRFPRFSDRLIFSAQETGADGGIVDQNIEVAKSFGRSA
jgi:hypothetical protein